MNIHAVNRANSQSDEAPEQAIQIRPLASILNATDAAMAKEAETYKTKHQASVRRAVAINAILTVIEQQGRSRLNSRDAQTSELIEKALHQLAEIPAEAPPEGTERGDADGRYSPSVDGAIGALGAKEGSDDE